MTNARRGVRKAVFPVAGLGTRFLPATKACPKELLPIVDKPLIQYAVDEAVAAGITETIFVTGRTKRAIEDHFDKAYEDQRASVIAVQEADLAQVHQYGIVKPGRTDGLVRAITDIVEKPRAEDAPSTLAVVGRYVLAPAIFDEIVARANGRVGEIQLTDAIRGLLRSDEVLAYEFEGDRYDCGAKLGYLKAQVSYGRNHPDCGHEFTAWLAAGRPVKPVRGSIARRSRIGSV